MIIIDLWDNRKRDYDFELFRGDGTIVAFNGDANFSKLFKFVLLTSPLGIAISCKKNNASDSFAPSDINNLLIFIGKNI